MNPLSRATIAVFNATATDEQKRLRDTLHAAYAEVTDAPAPPRREYGTTRAALLAYLREHPRSSSKQIAAAGFSVSLTQLYRDGFIVREPSDRLGKGGLPIHLYSVKDDDAR